MTAIYHITHLNNLPSILHQGAIWCEDGLAANRLTHVNIAYQHIKDRRATKQMPSAAGGTLSNYVPFYFAPRSPMLYAINRGLVEGYSDGQGRIVHLVSSAEAVAAAGLSYAFTDGHADAAIWSTATDKCGAPMVLLETESSMIEFKSGNLLQADAEALVNTVNTVGVMGKGIALQFKQAFPENFKAYEKAAKRGEIQPGQVFVYETGQFGNPRYILNFPTKRHWRGKSRLEDIEAGLVDLVRIVRDKSIHSIAVPPLGCGFGGLQWEEVRPLIVGAFGSLPEVRVWIYPPAGTLAAEAMPVATSRPKLTLGRAALIELIDRYALPGYRVSQLEIQKLAYFLQMAGEPLKLKYVKDQYGPYADNLNFVLQKIEGHYLRGYGARTGRSNLYLLPDAKANADDFLTRHPETRERLERVAELIQGFETPYGLELLATVHWLAQEDPDVRNDFQAAVRGFQNWNQHKREHFRPEHIQAAWQRLREQGWLSEPS